MADQLVERWSLDFSTEEAQRSLDAFSSRMTSSFTAGGLAVKALEKTFGLFTSAIKTGVKEFMETQAATIRLETAVKAFGATSGATVGQLSALSEKMSALTGIEADQLMSMQSTMLMYGVAGDKIEEYTRASVSLANVTGTSVEAAFQRLLRTQSGVVDRTMKMIPGIQDLTKEQLENGDAVGLINDKWGEFIDIQNRGVAGEVNKLTLAWKNMNEALVTSAANAGAIDALTTSMQGLAGLFSGKAGSALYSLLFEMSPEDVAARARATMQQQIAAIPEPALVDVMTGKTVGGGPVGTARKTRGAKERAEANLAKVGSYGESGTDYSGVGFAGPGYEGLEFGGGDTGGPEGGYFDERLNQRRMKAEELLTQHLKSQAEARQEIIQREGEAQSEAVRKWADTVQEGVGIGIGALEELVLRGKDAAWRFVVTQLGAIGQRLFMKGVADIAEGVAISANPLTPGLGGPLIAAGIKETVIGGGLAAGSLAIQATSGSFDQGGGGTGGGGGGGSAAFAGSAGAGSQREQTEAPQPITIVLQGPVYDGAAAGVAIAEKIAEARKQGLIR